MLLAAWRLLSRPDLDDDDAPRVPRAEKPRWFGKGGPAMRDLAFVGFLAALLALGCKRPFLFVLAYVYIDTVSPQRLSYYLLN